jgi:hypothetical protein
MFYEAKENSLYCRLAFISCKISSKVHPRTIRVFDDASMIELK